MSTAAQWPRFLGGCIKEVQWDQDKGCTEIEQTRPITGSKYNSLYRYGQQHKKKYSADLDEDMIEELHW